MMSLADLPDGAEVRVLDRSLMWSEVEKGEIITKARISDDCGGTYFTDARGYILRVDSDSLDTGAVRLICRQKVAVADDIEDYNYQEAGI